MDYPFSNKHLIVVTLVYIPVRCLRSYPFSLNIFALLIDLIVSLVPFLSRKASIINFKDSIFFVFVQVYVYKSLVNIRYSIPLESSLCNRL
jgi:hypothetical protein